MYGNGAEGGAECGRSSGDASEWRGGGEDGSVAKDIDIDQPLTWATTSRLTLDAQQSVTVKKLVTISGTGNLSIVTNDGGGKKGEFVIVPERGNVQFWDSASSLIIDGNDYTLVGDIKTLASDIAANPSGFYALAKPYDASVDGAYGAAPAYTEFSGTFEGLGNEFSGLTISDTSQDVDGLFGAILDGGIVRHLGVVKANVTNFLANHSGLLTPPNLGEISRCWATGKMVFSAGSNMGGFVGVNEGDITDSYADVIMEGSRGASGNVGGLVGQNSGIVESSFSRGSVSFASGQDMNFGGLVALNDGLVENSFARSRVKTAHGRKINENSSAGGLVGKNGAGARIAAAYAAGEMVTKADEGVGGLVGFDASQTGSISISYWDLGMGISDPSQGAGNIPNDPGITGLTDAQLKSGLPAGFDPKIWGSNPKINNGYPYLLANPPQ